MKRFLPLIPLLLLAACGPKWQETEADGHAYDFAFGLNWSGVIDDARVQQYRK